jgi:cyclic lactone autoinducer peptide
LKNKVLKVLLTVVALVAVFVAQVSAASACFWSWYDPELPKELK